MIIRLLCIGWLAMTHFTSLAQPAFVNKTRQYKNDLPTRSVMPGAMLDLNGDLIDDLAVLDRGKELKIIISSGKNFSLAIQDSLTITQLPEWTMTAGDIDNDGSTEILTAGEYGPVSLISTKDRQLSRNTMPGNIYAQGSNTIDINNDGWLDYFLCNDDGYSKFYVNDKNGNLVLTNVIDFSKNDNSDGSGNYGSEWTDVNGDLKPDLCISKCRAGVTSPTDPRRINRLYINNGDGSFDEKGADYGLNSGEQTWVTAFGDLDNDGDQDAFVVNHYGPHALMENIGGQFFREIPLSETLMSFGFQAVMRDFDNDGWLDIMLVGVEGSLLLHNRGTNTFNIIRKIIGPNPPRSLTVGDINDDGFLDIHAHMCEPINEVGVKNDELWINKSNENHFLKVNLEGSLSNKSGIGSLVEIYGLWGKQVRYVKGGESYGIFNSLQQHFGLEKAQIVDSLIIRWPSGKVDKYMNLEPNHTYFAQEGLCCSKSPTIYDEALISNDNLVLLTAPGGFENYKWSNGQTKDTASVNLGTYFVRMMDANGCVTVSKPIVVRSGCFPENVKLINENPNVVLCSGQQLEVTAIPAATYLWSTGATSAAINLDMSQYITLTASDLCGNILTDHLDLQIKELIWQLKGDTVKKGESATLVSDKKYTSWYQASDLEQPFFEGDTLITGPLDSTSTFFAGVAETIDKKTAYVGENNFPLSNLYGATSSSGSLIFNVESECILKTIKVNTDREGIRRFLIIDGVGDTIFTKDVMVMAGIETVRLDAALKKGDLYSLTTDVNVNMSSLGYRSPRFVRTINNTFYPYVLNDVVTILSSSAGAIYYYYFYDWEVDFDLITCKSPLKSVSAVVQKESFSDDSGIAKSFKIFPNPVDNELYLENPLSVQKAEIFDTHGRIVAVIRGKEPKADVSSLAPGMYMICIHNDQGISYLKFIKN